MKNHQNPYLLENYPKKIIGERQRLSVDNIEDFKVKYMTPKLPQKNANTKHRDL